MLLHCVGDCIGYCNGRWEFNYNGRAIYEELKQHGDIDSLELNPVKWMASDDTVLHLANAEFLANKENFDSQSNVFMKLIPVYKHAMTQMDRRAPGATTINAVDQLNASKENGYQLPFNPRGGGCGSSMRSSCIGLRYPKRDQLNDLIVFSIESGRMTHHHPVGYLGGLAAALLTSYAIQNIPIKAWGAKCLDDLQAAKQYIKKANLYVDENLKSWKSFEDPWRNYLKTRNIENGTNEPVFPDKYDFEERDEFYKTISGRSWAGSSGVDSCLIAYDALLGCKGDWKELCYRSMIHGGDNDSTGCIAASWYGAIFGFKGVNPKLYEKMEFRQRLLECANRFYELYQS